MNTPVFSSTSSEGNLKYPVRIRQKEGDAVTKTATKTKVQQWEERILEVFKEKIQPTSTTGSTPRVVEDTLKDARSLFGGVGLKNKITLRTAQQMRRGSTIVLQQFDPNFFSPREARCRVSGCPEKKLSDPSGPSKKISKKDLYLCPTHRARMTDYVTKQCAEKNVAVNFESSNPGDFDGYISLIGLMEKAYYCLVKYTPGGPQFLRGSPKILPEIFLNVRNFLFITNAVLNPDERNLGFALPSVMNILMDILDRSGSSEFVENLAFLMRDIMETILFSFGVVYTWVSLALTGNPGTQVGMGVGGALGAAAAGWAFGPVVGLIGVGVGIGLLCGGLIGGGAYNMQRQENEQLRQDEGLRRYRELVRRPVEPQPNADDVVYHFTGNIWGDIVMAALLVEILLIL